MFSVRSATFFRMDRARKKIASAIDGIRSNLHLRTELEVNENIASEHCFLADVVRHGFPAGLLFALNIPILPLF